MGGNVDWNVPPFHMNIRSLYIIVIFSFLVECFFFKVDSSFRYNYTNFMWIFNHFRSTDIHFDRFESLVCLLPVVFSGVYK